MQARARPSILSRKDNASKNDEAQGNSPSLLTKNTRMCAHKQHACPLTHTVRTRESLPMWGFGDSSHISPAGIWMGRNSACPCNIVPKAQQPAEKKRKSVCVSFGEIQHSSFGPTIDGYSFSNRKELPEEKNAFPVDTFMRQIPLLQVSDNNIHI